MGTPKQVKKLAEKGRKIAEELGNPETPAGDVPPEEAAPGQDHEEEKEPPEAAPEEGGEPLDTPQEEPEEEGEPEDPAPSEEPKEGSTDYWKSRFQSTEGILRKTREEIRESRQSTASLQENQTLLIQENTRLRQENERLQAGGGQGPREGGQEEPKGGDKKKFSPEAVEQYGEEFVGMAEELSHLGISIEELQRERVEDAKNSFETRLVELAPQAKEQNDDPEFVAHLGRSDPYTGRPRVETLDKALASHNAVKVAAIFNEFASLTGKYGNGSAQPSEKPPTEDPRRSLERQVQPPKKKQGAPPQSEDKPTYTRAWIKGFYKDRADKKWVGREKEAERIRTDIMAASAEGRITG